MKALVLRKYHLYTLKDLDLVDLSSWIKDVCNVNTSKRARRLTRFLRILNDCKVEMQQEWNATTERFAEKDEEGNIIYLYEKAVKDAEGQPVKDKDGNKVLETLETTDKDIGKRYKITDLVGYNTEFINFLNEKVVIDVVPSNEDTLNAVREMIMDENYVFPRPLLGRMVELHGEIYDAFERMNDEIKEKKPDENEAPEGEGGISTPVDPDPKPLPTEPVSEPATEEEVAV